MQYSNARDCFDENVRTVANPVGDVESQRIYNLNNGLAALAESLDRDIRDLRKEIQTLTQLIKSLRAVSKFQFSLH